MKINIKTKVNQPYQQVFAQFDQALFKALAPPFPRVKLLKYDGSKVGDWVIIQLNFLFFKQVWESEIVEAEEQTGEIYFIDEGRQLPFFLKYWRHRHRVVAADHQSFIIDEITYKTPFALLDWLMYPLMYGQFLYRKPIYKKKFR
ncbi:MAG: hypothetical protein ACFB0B_11535 [Thermonemataceae bacterium]